MKQYITRSPRVARVARHTTVTNTDNPSLNPASTGGGCSVQRPSWTASSSQELAKVSENWCTSCALATQMILSQEKPMERLSPVNQWSQENERCQENVLPCKMASPRLPLPLPCPPNLSHGNASQKHWVSRGPPLSTHPHHFTGILPASTSPQNASQDASQSHHTGLPQDPNGGKVKKQFQF